MPRQSLGRLGRNIRSTEIRDEGVPHCVEVGKEALGVLVAEESGLFATLALGLALGSGDRVSTSIIQTVL